MIAIRASAIVVSVILMALPFQQPAGADQSRGKKLAEQQCSQCHGVKRNEKSPSFGVSSFTEIADEPSITENALRVYLNTSHPKIPSLIIKTEDIDDIVSYIASLKLKN